MARRNIFQPPAPPATPPEPVEPRTRFPETGAMSGMKSTLRDLSSNAVREIDPAYIDGAGPKDRLDFSDEDVADLAESIRAHGQQVPIMVRPIAERPGYYRIVYGRRRLRALSRLGVPAKALVRSLNDEQAILAQGQENSQRLDPSFIEKALFVNELSTSGYDGAIIMDALAIDKPMLSRMSKVATTLPETIIRAIGPAHGIGRRRWEDLANIARDHDVDLEETGLKALEEGGEPDSDSRFLRVLDAVKASLPRAEAPPAPAVRELALEDGSPLGQVRQSGKTLTLRLSTTDNPEFTAWIGENAEDLLRRLHADWQSEGNGQG